MTNYTEHIAKFPDIMQRRRDALELFDAGIPNEIQDTVYKAILNAHRWGWHGEYPIGDLCPACERAAQ